MTEAHSEKQLSRIVLKGFKSIAACDIELSRINILIGANGAGKSNFIGFFRMVQQLLDENLQVFVSRQGGPDTLLYFGRKTTEQLEFRLYFGNNGYFATIVKTIRLVAPFFGDFYLRPSPQNKKFIELEWFEKGQDIPFKAHILSDGILRFICLATVFLQPEELQPETILVDEPELGLHPYAIKILASLIKTVSKQVIVSTQSVELLNEFDAGDVIVVDRLQGKSRLRRLDEQELEEWLQEYSLGELWKKNILGGRPSR